MIFDRIDQAASYPMGSLWTQAFEFLSTLSDELPDGRHDLQGDDLFAILMRYDSKSSQGAILETHETYLDIQVVLEGREACYWVPAEGLEVRDPYDPERDAAFYNHPEDFPARVLLSSGYFAAFLPQDAHMPSIQVMDGAPEPVRKVVIKIRRTLVAEI